MSSVGVLEPHVTASRPGRGALVAITLAMLGAVIFVVLAALPYFTFLFSDAPNQFVDEVSFRLYFPRRGWLLLHIAGGIVAVLAGPVQLWLGLSDRHMGLHRRLGLTYISGVAIGTVGAVALAGTDAGGMDIRRRPAGSRNRVDDYDRTCVRVDTAKPHPAAQGVDDPQLRGHVRVRDVPRWRRRHAGGRRRRATAERRISGLGVLGRTPNDYRGSPAGEEDLRGQDFIRKIQSTSGSSGEKN